MVHWGNSLDNQSTMKNDRSIHDFVFVCVNYNISSGEVAQTPMTYKVRPSKDNNFVYNSRQVFFLYFHRERAVLRANPRARHCDHGSFVPNTLGEGGMPVGVFLRSPSPYLCYIQRKTTQNSKQVGGHMQAGQNLCHLILTTIQHYARPLICGQPMSSLGLKHGPLESTVAYTTGDATRQLHG